MLNKDALLELNTDKQGLLLPRVSKSKILTGGALYAAADGMFVYIQEEASLYLKKGGAWQKVADFANITAGTGIAITGNTISNAGVTSFKTRTGAVVPAAGDYTLGLMGDVALATPANNEVLTFDQSSGKWINKALAASTLTVSAPLAGAGTAASPLGISAGTTSGQVLKWNGTAWAPGDDLNGGTAYGTLTSADITGAISTDAQFRMKIWKGPGAKVTNGPDTGPTGAAAWSVLSFQNTSGTTNYTTQMYFDKNTLALKEWTGGTTLTDNGNPWYKVVTTLGSNLFTPGGLMFANMTTDATSEVTQDAANLFWDNSSKELGIKTNSPSASLDVNGTVKLGGNGSVLNGIIRSTNINGSPNSIAGTGWLGSPTTTSVTFSVPDADESLHGNVIINPRFDFPSTLSILSSRVSSDGTVTVVFLNSNSSSYSISGSTKRFDITVIQ